MICRQLYLLPEEFGIPTVNKIYLFPSGNKQGVEVESGIGQETLGIPPCDFVNEIVSNKLADLTIFLS